MVGLRFPIGFGRLELGHTVIDGEWTGASESKNHQEEEDQRGEFERLPHRHQSIGAVDEHRTGQDWELHPRGDAGQ